jgi:hypothetical protein
MQSISARISLSLLFCTYQLLSQSPRLDEAVLPPAAPGYHIYFRDDDGLLIKPERWGYHDGWLQGRLDISEGRQRDTKTNADSIKVLLHGTAGNLPESQYRRVYRSAYLRGYEHGYRL